MLHIFPTPSELTQAAAELFVRLANEAVTKYGRFLVALSGGSTPEGLFKLLAQPAYANQIPWVQTHFCWGDERLVPPDQPGSNYHQTAQLLLNHAPIPPTNIHRAKGELPPAEAVADYAAQLQALAAQDQRNAPWPVFDLVLLGMGSDGHTASLFPGPILPEETEQPIIAVTAHYDGRPAHRLSLTPLVFNDARHILFLVTGKNKAETITAVLHSPHQPHKYPAQRIRPTHGTLHWFIDQEAAGRISEQ